MQNTLITVGQTAEIWDSSSCLLLNLSSTVGRIILDLRGRQVAKTERVGDEVSLARKAGAMPSFLEMSNSWSFARSWFPKAWWTALCSALRLPQLLLDSRLVLAIWSNSCRTVQTQLFSEYDWSHTIPCSNPSNGVYLACESSFLVYEGKIMVILTSEEFYEDHGSW